MKNLVKKATLFSLAVGLGVTHFSCSSQPSAKLKSDIDSLSYASGVNVTQGLEQYLNQLGIDSTLMKDFIAGLIEGSNVDKNDKKATARTTGFQVGQQVQQMIPSMERQFFGADTLTKLSKNDFLAGFIASATQKDLKISKEEAQTVAATISAKVLERVNAPVKAENEQFLEDNKSKDGVITTESGLQYKVTTLGKGEKPVVTDEVKVHYHGTTINGETFDSSVERGAPATFPLNGVIRGWTEVLQLVPVGTKLTAYIPYNLAYGEQGDGRKIGPFATLIFDIELIDIVKNDTKKK
ncbi:peptidyl-prolyl cis-trans isomerase [Bacteroidia bacterium]|nr:peptidyl-prolyl cis-trans isomerase [Bacteroidia bacterium]